MTIDTTPGPDPLVQQVGENVTTLMFRMGWSQTAAAAAWGMSQPSLSRKRRGDNEWTLGELAAITATTYVELPELLSVLPSFDVWCARRDSNSQPSDP